MELKGKTILITGGRRVGQSVLEEIGRAGANVVMTYRKGRAEMAGAARKVAQAYKVRTTMVELDLAHEESIRALTSAVAKDFGGIDGLVNMASVFEPDPKEIAMDDVLRAVSAAGGSVLLSRWFAEEAQRRNARSAPIVTFIDWAVDHPYPDYDLYLASKAFLRHYLMALQTTFAGTVRIVNVHPGMILEPPDFPPAEKQVIIDNTPTQSIGTPEQAAQLVRSALELDFLVGNVYLDGGQHWRHRLPKRS